MSKHIIRKSKKGFSLPAAMGITAVLIILSASLIIIASNSISNTSLTVNSRQAYLNVRSALQYAETYYDNLTNIQLLANSDTKKEYIIMKDNAGGTVNDGADVSSNESSTNDKLTYVEATYTPAKGKESSKLKLTAYANYADTFGNKGGSSQLSATYDVSNGSSGRRITDPTIPPSVSTKDYSDTITLNVKRHPGQTWGSISYYVWTFKDVAGVYSDKSTSYDVKPTVAQANTNEDDRPGHENVVHPAGDWVGEGSADKLGPPSLVTEIGGGWLSSTFTPKDEYVNYFNIIFANKGSILKDDINNKSQSCEMFHLWYLDPSDKNIYFEFLQSQLYYYTGKDWNGKTNLEADPSAATNSAKKDSILVYVNNPKTTVHFKMKGIDDTAVVPTVSRPVINSVTVSGTPISGDSYLGTGSKAVNNMKMTYEGCGWWVANVETNDTFKMKITYSSESGLTHTRTVTVTPNSDNEAWVYADMLSGTIQSRLSEQNANVALGVSSDSYVTVHAKAYDTKNKATPLLNYQAVELNSSTGRINLYNKILEAYQYNESNYTETSYKVLKQVLNEDTGTGITDSSGNKIGAVAVYNDVKFISNQSGSTSAEKIKNADKKYNDIVKKIDEAINGLVSKECDEDTLNTLLNLVKQGDDAVAEQSRSGKYDSGAYGVFIVDSGAYKTAKNMVANPSTLKIDEVGDQITALQAALDELNKHVLDRTGLENAINEAKKLSVNTRYEQSYRNDLNTQIAEAQTAYSKKETTQTAIDTAKTKLQPYIDDAPNHTVTTFDMERISKAISDANDLLSRKEKINCTDETYTALQTAYNAANSIITSTEATQETIDAEAANLENAVKLFTVEKPEATNDKLDSEHKIRVWLSGTEKYEYTLDLYRESGSDSYKYTSTALKSDAASGLSYIDINKTIYSKVGITITKDGQYYKSNEISIKDDGKELIDDNNLVVHFEGTFDDKALTCTVSQKKLTTLYIEKPDGTSYSPLVKVNDKEVKTSAEMNYLAARFVSEDSQKVVINSNSDGSGTDTNAFDVSAGQFVVRYKTDKDVELINVKSIYPIYATTTASSTGYKISDATIDAENLISPTILANATGEYSIGLTSTTEIITEPINITPPSGKIVILVDTNGVGALTDKTPIAHIWGSKGDYDKFPGNALLRYENTNYYYTIVDDDVTGMTISSSYDGSGKSKVGGDIQLDKKAGDRYILLRHNDPGKNFNDKVFYPNAKYPVPQIDRTIYNVSVGDMTASDISMAFVGGDKVRITNKSYIETYPSGGKKNQNHSVDISNSNKFGANGVVAADKKDTMNRVGDSQLSAYYDWYEFKIPVDKISNYTFDIQGLKGGTDTTLTQQISGAYGDVWITLNSNSTTKDSENKDRYKDLSIYTFDPEKGQMEYVYDKNTKQMIEKTRIYFNMPSGWKDAKVSVSGTGTSTTLSFTDKMSNYASNSSAVHYYYVDVDVKTPFLVFNATKDDGTAYQCRTSLQGGDTVLFDPTMNSNYGGWDDYVSPQTCLKREVLKAQTMYYGSVIIGKYDDDGSVVSNGSHTYNYAENLAAKYDAFTSSPGLNDSNDHDKTIDLSKIYTLSDSNADEKYTKLNEWVTLYENLYSAMSSAKMYIEEPITEAKNSKGENIHTGGGQYPEYKNRNNYQKYDNNCITTLKAKLRSAEEMYMSSSATVDDIKEQTRGIKSATSNVTVKSEGSITLIFYDAQEVAKNGAKIEVQYTGSKKDKSGNITLNSTPDVKEVTSKNPEGYPIIRIADPKIINVTFLVNGVPRTSTKDEMLEDSTWVFMDQKDKPEWKENTTCDYITINTDSFEQMVSTDTYKIKMKYAKDEEGKDQVSVDKDKDESVYKDTVLYFTKDTTVTRIKDDSTGEKEKFTIQAGAYVFTNKDTKDKESPFVRKYDDKENKWICEFDLYSDESKAYFTNPVNYGELTGATNASSIGWINSSGALAGSFKTTPDSVNITAMNTTINSYRKYTSLQSMYFRYADNNHNLVINNTLTLTAKDFVIASTSTFDGTHTIAPHFYLSSSDYSSDKPLEVTFKTDINVKYRDNTGANHSFIIREGTYELSKKTDSQTFVADFFDESYWKSPFVVCTTSGGTGAYSGKGGSLSNPVYSNN